MSEETKPLSTLYSVLAELDTSKVSQLFSVWQADIPTLANDDWEEGIQQYLPLVISARDRFTPIIAQFALNVLRRWAPSFMLSGPPSNYKLFGGEWSMALILYVN